MFIELLVILWDDKNMLKKKSPVTQSSLLLSKGAEALHRNWYKAEQGGKPSSQEEGMTSAEGIRLCGWVSFELGYRVG